MPTKWTRPGQMRHHILLQEDRGAAQTSSGQHISDWQTYARSWASVEPLTGRDFWQSQQVAGALTTHVVKMYYQPNVKPEDRVVFKGRVFDVAYAHDLEEQQRELNLYCTEDLKATYTGGELHPLSLTTPLAWYSAGYGQSTFNVANFSNTNTTQYFSNSNASWLNGLTKLTLSCWINLSNNTDNDDLHLFSQWDQANQTQNCFYLKRDGVSKQLQIYIANGLTDGGNNGVTSTLTVKGLTSGPTAHHVVMVYDGTLTGNANRVKFYIDGVLDTTATISGIIPAQLTSANTPFQFGHRNGLNSQLFRGQAWDLMAWAGTALTTAQAQALATFAANGNPIPYNGVLPAGVPVPDYWWKCDEVSAGGALVTRVDSRNAYNFADVGSIPSGAIALWADRFGNGNLAMSALGQGSNFVNATPVLVTGPNDLSVWSFTGNLVIGNFNCRRLGLTTNPAAWTVFTVLYLDHVNTAQAFHGAEQYGGLDGNNVSHNVWGYLEATDFATTNTFGMAMGSGTATDAGHTAYNTATPKQWLVVTQRYTPGDSLPHLRVNGIDLPVQSVAGNPTFPAFSKITSCGGTMQNWRIGQLGDFDESVYEANFKGMYAEQIIVGAAIDDQEMMTTERWLGQRFGVAVA